MSKKLLCLAFIFLVSGCERENLNEKPISYWVDSGDTCVSGTAKAIVDSGLPYPHFTYEARVNEKTGKEEQRVKTVDVWLLNERFAFPRKYVSSHGGYAKTHPYKYHRLHGSLPNFYPKGPSAGVKDGMASMVDVKFDCSMAKHYTADWDRPTRTNVEGVAWAKSYLQEEADRHNNFEGSTTQATVTVSVREDLKMIEILLDKGFADDRNPKPWSAIYWPLEAEMRSFNGRLGPIGCDIRHDPVERRYGGRGWRCSSSIRINPYASAGIDIYVPHIEAMPEVYRQVKQLIIDSKQPTGR